MNAAIHNFITKSYLKYSPSDCMDISLHEYIIENLPDHIVVKDKDLDNIYYYFEYLVSLGYDIIGTQFDTYCDFNKLYDKINRFFGIDKTVRYFAQRYAFELNDNILYKIIHMNNTNTELKLNRKNITEIYGIDFDSFLLYQIKGNDYNISKNDVEHILPLLDKYDDLKKTILYKIIIKTGIEDIKILENLVLYSCSKLVTLGVILQAILYKIYEPESDTVIFELPKEIEIPYDLQEELAFYSDNYMISVVQLKKYLDYKYPNNKTLIEKVDCEELSKFYIERAVVHGYDNFSTIEYYENKNYYYFSYKNIKYSINKCSLMGLLLKSIITNNYFYEILLEKQLKNIQIIKPIIEEKYSNYIENIIILDTFMNLEEYDPKKTTIIIGKYSSRVPDVLTDIKNWINDFFPISTSIKFVIDEFYYNKQVNLENNIIYTEFYKNSYPIPNFLLTLDILNNDNITYYLNYHNIMYLRKLCIDYTK